jgi:predicted transcriptional regulator
MPVTLRVRDVMDKKIVQLDEKATIAQAIKAMLDNEVWSLVITRNNLPVGVVTERDIIRRVYCKGLFSKHGRRRNHVQSD